jgi:hypothetical protein
MKVYFSSAAMVLTLQLLGCNVDIQQTDNGVTIAIECGETPSDDQPAAEEPGTDVPSTDDPAAEQPSTDQPSTHDGAEPPLSENG